MLEHRHKHPIATTKIKQNLTLKQSPLLKIHHNSNIKQYFKITIKIIIIKNDLIINRIFTINIKKIIKITWIYLFTYW